MRGSGGDAHAQAQVDAVFGVQVGEHLPGLDAQNTGQRDLAGIDQSVNDRWRGAAPVATNSRSNPNRAPARVITLAAPRSISTAASFRRRSMSCSA